MLRAMATALGLRRGSDQSEGIEAASLQLATPDAPAKRQSTPAPTAHRLHPVTIDTSRVVSRGAPPGVHCASPIASVGPVPTLQARPPRDHAQALLTWLQGAGGRTGSILASELEELHREMCAEVELEPVGWIAVGRELRRLLGAKKEYVREGGRRLCVYRIPPAIPRALDLRAA